MQTSTPAWWSDIQFRLDDLGRLPFNWNSYGAQRIRSSALWTALELLRQITTRNTPQPTIVPTSDGSVQIEWHTRGIDLEVRVLSSTKVSVAFEDMYNQVEPIDEELEYDFRSLVQAINLLSSR